MEDCEEIEIIIESDEEGEVEENAAAIPNRPVTPTPIQDFGTSVIYMEGNLYNFTIDFQIRIIFI